MPGHGGHGGGFHGGGFGRRGWGWGGGGWGGYGYDWPGMYSWPCYQDQFGNCIPYPGVPVMDSHALVQGFHRGHLYQHTLAQIAPLLHAPSAIPTKIEVELNGHELTVAVELDGKIYRGTADLSQVFDVARHYLRAYHEQLHNEPHMLLGAAAPSAEEIAAPVSEHVVACGVRMLVGQMIAEHQQPYAELCAGWWSDIEHAVKHGLHDVENVAKGALKDLEGPIAAAAGVAAGAILGPQAGQLASSLAGSLMGSITGQGSTKQAAQQVVQQAQQMATSNPAVAQALSSAQQAVAQGAAGVQTAQTFAAAAKGSPQALQQVNQLAQAAQSGDASAQGALDIAQAAVTDASSGGTDNSSDPSVSGWFLPFMGGALTGYVANHYGVFNRPIEWIEEKFGHHPQASATPAH